jgi:phenylpropionate dioxygenase-like ring-hydroxylating dioxygenase large terminal subunit
MESTTRLTDDATVAQRLLDHIDRKTTDLGTATWREPVENYRSLDRFAAECALMRALPAAFFPSAALPKTRAYVARNAAGTPLLAVRAGDGRVRVFRNACRHRGTQLAQGAGCEKSFVCPYHGWTYALDGSLRHVPHEHGFPGLDKRMRGLVEVPCEEAQGLVFVTQDAGRASDARPRDLPPLVDPGYRLANGGEREIAANWKIVAEGFLEGYHIRSTHPETFYPLQYDNINVIERFGPHNRVAFPYQAINKLRSLPPAERSVEGKLTYVYHLFPNVMFATFPRSRFLVVLEPLAVDRTLLVTYILTDPTSEDRTPPPAAESGTLRGAMLVAAGGAEDQAVAAAIQRSLASGANEFFEFGLFESAIVHFHQTLHAALGETP